MKTCPDCAESVQDGARKCRFCGFRFDEPASAGNSEQDALPTRRSDDSGAQPASTPPESRPATAGARRSGAWLLLAAGGIVFLLAVLAGVLLDLSPSPNLGTLVTACTCCACAMIGLAWLLLLPSGNGSLAAALGAFAVPLTTAILYVMLGQGFGRVENGVMLIAAVGCIGPAIMMIAHYQGLEGVMDFELARFGSLVAAIGVGGQGVLLLKHWGLPQFVFVTLNVVFVLGAATFSIGIVLGAITRRR